MIDITFELDSHVDLLFVFELSADVEYVIDEVDIEFKLDSVAQFNRELESFVLGNAYIYDYDSYLFELDGEAEFVSPIEFLLPAEAEFISDYEFELPGSYDPWNTWEFNGHAKFYKELSFFLSASAAYILKAYNDKFALITVALDTVSTNEDLKKASNWKIQTADTKRVITPISIGVGIGGFAEIKVPVLDSGKEYSITFIPSGELIHFVGE